MVNMELMLNISWLIIVIVQPHTAANMAVDSQSQH